MDIVDLYLYDLKTKFNKINPKEYYLSYSGGKDSHLLYWFIKEYAKIDGIKIIGINTYMEHPEIRKRIYKYCDKVLLPILTPTEIKEKYGIPCFSKSQDDFIDTKEVVEENIYLIGYTEKLLLVKMEKNIYLLLILIKKQEKNFYLENCIE